MVAFVCLLMTSYYSRIYFKVWNNKKTSMLSDITNVSYNQLTNSIIINFPLSLHVYKVASCLYAFSWFHVLGFTYVLFNLCVSLCVCGYSHMSARLHGGRRHQILLELGLQVDVNHLSDPLIFFYICTLSNHPLFILSSCIYVSLQPLLSFIHAPVFPSNLNIPSSHFILKALGCWRRARGTQVDKRNVTGLPGMTAFCS